MFIVGGPFALPILHHSFTKVANAYYIGFTNQKLTHTQAQEPLYILKTVYRLYFACTAVHLMIVVINSLVVIEVIAKAQVEIALGALSLLYAIICAEWITHPLINKIKSNSVTTTDTTVDTVVNPPTKVFVGMFGLWIFMILFLPIFLLVTFVIIPSGQLNM